MAEKQSLQKNSAWGLAIEMRDSSWYDPAVYQMLKKYEASLVFHDMPASKTPLEQPATTIAYLRLHGPTGDYKGSYNARDPGQYAELIRHWHTKEMMSLYISTILLATPIRMQWI